MIRKILAVLFVLLVVSGALYAQHGRAKRLSGDFFGQEAADKNIKFIAGTYAPEIITTRWPDTDCDSESLNQWCFAVTDAEQILDVPLTNVTSIVIPARTLHDVLLVEARNFYWVSWNSELPYPTSALFLNQPTITIKSSALPAPIKANMGHRRISKWLTMEESYLDVGPTDDMQYNRSYRLTRSLMKLAGYTDAQVEGFFASDITIELNYQVKVKAVDFTDSYYDLMIYGY